MARSFNQTGDQLWVSKLSARETKYTASETRLLHTRRERGLVALRHWVLGPVTSTRIRAY